MSIHSTYAYFYTRGKRIIFFMLMHYFVYATLFLESIYGELSYVKIKYYKKSFWHGY